MTFTEVVVSLSKYIKKGRNKVNETFFQKCWCGTCGCLSDQQLREIYCSAWIIAENSKEVYQIFAKDTVK